MRRHYTPGVDRDGWNARYRADECVWSAEPNRFLREETADLPPGRALDLACGEGRNAIWLAALGWRVTAVDFSDVGLDKAERLAAARGLAGIDWILADLDRYRPEARAFDLVIVLYLHLPWPRMDAVLRRAAEAVAPGGTFLLVGHDLANLADGHGGPRSPDVLYTAEQVVAALPGLRVVEAARRQRPVDRSDGTTAIAIDALVRAERPDTDPAG